jgi:hypothetical protein
LALLSARPNPDYRNSIKESISAIESIARLIGKDVSGLDKPLAALKEKANLHPAMVDSFCKLYGYTSTDTGIRHALVDESYPVDFPDAKFMLVSCSGFVSFLIEKSRTAGLLTK